MKVAYADPPYIGKANLYPEKTEVDHLELLERLCRDYDAWALSCSSPTVNEILKLDTCPASVRIGAWVKPWSSFKPNVDPAYSWEPILFIPAPRAADRSKPTTKDWVAANATLQKGLIGAKPFRFCMWLFDLLRCEPDDELDDLFPGTGVVSKAWQVWCDKQRHTQIAMELEV